MGVLSDEDQRLSDRAVAACSAASVEARERAWASSGRIAQGSALLERASVYAAYLLLLSEGLEPLPNVVRNYGRRLEEVHHRHDEAIRARKEGGDAVG
jgi:hypothetical protein